jgi:tripartite-type tricarboxylate transporter receptor subunit TctC
MKLKQKTTFATSGKRFAVKKSQSTWQNWTFLARAFAFTVTVACVGLLAFPKAARADWPERPVKLIVTCPAGSANDAAARIFADRLSKRWGKPVVVEDKPGAEGTIGVGAFVSAQDDHTLLYTVAGSVSVAPLLIDKLTYGTWYPSRPRPRSC